MSEPWWESWATKELSPLNPLAVATAQLSPPEDWEETWRPSIATLGGQLFWLCWHARPDLRARQMDNYWFSQTNMHFMTHTKSIDFTIHPDTIAEWSKPPCWSDGRLQQQEGDIRVNALQSYDLTVEQCRSIHPTHWTPASLGYQAVQSEAHGKVLLAQIGVLDDVAFMQWIVEYVRWTWTLTGPCGAYVRSRLKTLRWPRWLADMLAFNLKPFPEELLPCLLNSPDPGVRQMGAALAKNRKKRGELV